MWAVSLLQTSWALCLVVVAFVAVYGADLVGLVGHWLQDDNYSHGFLVIPAALYLGWNSRDQLAKVPVRPTWGGAVLVGCSLGLLLIGTAGIELFVTRVSMIGVIAGAIACLYGWQYLRVLAFPVAFLLLMIPLPGIIFNQIAFPLQLVATQFGVEALHLASVPVFREGNVIVLASTTLEVAEACSGIRSLVSLITVVLLYAYFSDHGPRARTFIVLSAIPVAIVANGLRVAGTGLAAHYVGPEASKGFLHDFSGWLVFLLSFVMVVGVDKVVRAVMPIPRIVLAGWQRRSV